MCFVIEALLKGLVFTEDIVWEGNRLRSMMLARVIKNCL